MAKKKNEPRKAPLMQMPMGVASLSGDDLSGITRGINGGLLQTQQGTEQPTQDKQEKIEPATSDGTGAGQRGRPKKQETEIVEAQGNTDWERFEDYFRQYYKTRKEGVPVKISQDLINFFYRVKSTTDEKVDLTNMINAVIRLFVDKHKDYVNDLLVQKMREGN